MFLTHYPYFWYGHLNDKRSLKYKPCLQKFTDHEIITFHSLQVESDDTVSIPVMTSPNMKEICKKTEIDTPEKLMLLKSRASKVFQSVKEVCDSNGETLASVLGNVFF